MQLLAPKASCVRGCEGFYNKLYMTRLALNFNRFSRRQQRLICQLSWWARRQSATHHAAPIHFLELQWARAPENEKNWAGQDDKFSTPRYGFFGREPVVCEFSFFPPLPPQVEKAPFSLNVCVHKTESAETCRRIRAWWVSLAFFSPSSLSVWLMLGLVGAKRCREAVLQCGCCGLTSFRWMALDWRWNRLMIKAAFCCFCLLII